MGKNLHRIATELTALAKDIDCSKPEFLDIGGHKVCKEVRDLKATVKILASKLSDALDEKEAADAEEVDLTERR
jgi:hypothetical protein